jgi:hypothetical protein
VESTPAEPTPAEPTPQEETPVPAAPLDIVIEDEEEEEAGEPPAGPEDEQADQEDDIHVSSGADVVPSPEENPPPPVIEEPVAEDGSEPLNSIPAGEPPKSPITKDDVQTVKLVLPDGQTVKIAHRAKATVGKARSAAAAEIGTTVDKVVLSYGDSELDDATLIGELQISSSGRIVASVVD